MLKRIVSVSGGKDSTALFLWAIDQWGKDGFIAVFADTGHEHPVTLNYVRNMPVLCGGPEITWVRGDFRERLEKKMTVAEESESEYVNAIRRTWAGWLKERGYQTGSAFLDMLFWKGRIPSTKAQFCTEFTKMEPIRNWLQGIRFDDDIEMYVGIRAGESENRANLPEREWSEYYEDVLIVRPLLKWSEEDVFSFLESKKVQANPLYANGNTRVGCYPCIHARKSELANMPDWAWDKITDWESKIGRTWFAFGTIPLTGEQATQLKALESYETAIDEDSGEPYQRLTAASVIEIQKLKGKYSPPVAQVREWCKTSRGGKQFDLFTSDAKDVPSCMSTWGVCE